MAELPENTVGWRVSLRGGYEIKQVMIKAWDGINHLTLEGGKRQIQRKTVDYEIMLDGAKAQAREIDRAAADIVNYTAEIAKAKAYWESCTGKKWGEQK